jgi:SAM-dependent methyltransferase
MVETIDVVPREVGGMCVSRVVGPDVWRRCDWVCVQFDCRGGALGVMLMGMVVGREARQDRIDERILTFYGSEFDESDRLVGRSGQGVLEFERTQQLVRERVSAGSRIIDIGGAAGVHAAALAERGDTVVLVDPVPEHVDAAGGYGTFTARVGDARRLDDADHSYDAALLLGPLYHLHDKADRLQALRESVRVVRPGGWVFAAGISRLVAAAWVSVIEPAIRFATDGTTTVRAPLPDNWRYLLEDGRGGFGDSGFPGGHRHLAEELADEATAAGILGVEVHGLEGPAGHALEVSRSLDPTLLDAARVLAKAFATQPGLRDLSPHLLAIGRTPTS